jgi:hypothetical protein
MLTVSAHNPAHHFLSCSTKLLSLLEAGIGLGRQTISSLTTWFDNTLLKLLRFLVIFGDFETTFLTLFFSIGPQLPNNGPQVHRPFGLRVMASATAFIRSGE